MKPDCGGLAQREFGILLHVSSLPGTGSIGDFGPHAHRFVDFLSVSGARLWQTLPLVPTHICGSPYHGRSIHAGNPGFISPERLCDDGFISAQSLDRYQHRAREDGQRSAHAQVLSEAYQNLHDVPGLADGMAKFRRDNHAWLTDYALYRAAGAVFDDAPWYEWPQPLRDRHGGALEELHRQHQDTIDRVIFEQYLFVRQWHELKRYANRRGIRIMGDIPIFPAHDSAEVWAHRRLFQLDTHGRATDVAGVPPDYFSPTGQHWGNPLYDWKQLEQDGFQWWIDRIRLQLTYFDLLRLDHFRGFESYWSIPAGSADATPGHWKRAPGSRLLQALATQRTRLVAEDLGTITPEVLELRYRFGLPGMRVLQFAFDGQADNLHLPHHHELCSVVYTGTHDNQTTLGWFQGLGSDQQRRVYGYLGMPQEDMPWALTRTAMASVSRLTIIPMQDVMGLDDRARMNTPGTDSRANWSWRFDWRDVPAGTAERLRHLASVYDRSVD